MLHNIEKRMLNLLLLSTIGLQLCTPQISSGKLLIASAGAENDNYRDWARFDPRKFKAPHRLVPAAAVIQANANFFSHGIPSFPHDPSRSNVIYGRGTGLLPTELYSKAFDILNIGGKYFQAPGAGERKNVVMDGQSITIYGTTCYTPLPNSRYVGNPAQVSPFDPTRVFYKDKDMWPSVIYGEPGQEILIANQRVRIPAAGQTHEVVFGKDGKLKSGGTDSGSSNQINDQPNKDSNSQTKNYDNAKAANSSAASGSHSLNTSGGNSGASGSSESGGNSGIKTATNKPAQSTAGRAAADKAATDKAAADKAAADKAAADKAAADKAAADKAAADKAATDKAAADKAASDKAAADKAASDKAASDKAATDKAAADKAASEKAASDKAAADKAAADKAVADKAAADKAAADKAASDTTLASTGSDTIGGSGSGSGSTGNSGFGSTGNSGFGSTGNSGFGSTGNSGFGSTGSSGSGSTGSSSSGSTGSSSSGSTGSSSSGSTGSSGSGLSNGSSGSGSTGSSGSGSSTGSSGSGSSTGSSGYGIGGTGATASTDAGSGNAGDGGSGNVLAYSAESVAIPVTDKSTVKEDNGFFGWGAKQMFSIPIDKKKVCFYYDAGHTKEGEHDVVGTITGDISVLQQALAVDSATTADCELGVVAGPSAFVTARTLKIPTFRRIAEKSTAYPKLGPVIIAYKSNSSTLWTDSNTFVHNNPGLFAAPDSGVRYQNAGGAVGSAGGDSTGASYTDPNSGTQLKSANEEAFDLSRFVLKIMGQ